MAMKDYFAISLWDYTLPGFCSGTSYYYGTMDDMTHFMEELSRKEKDYFDDTISALERYRDGEIATTHNVAYSPCRLITPVKLLTERQISLPTHEWTYYNTYDEPYFLKCDGGNITQIVVKKENKYCRCLRGELENLSYTSDLDDTWRSLDGGFWGHPRMIEIERISKSSFRLKYALFVEEAVFDSKQQALSDFENNSIPDLSALAKDIFGDG